MDEAARVARRVRLVGAMLVAALPLHPAAAVPEGIQVIVRSEKSGVQSWIFLLENGNQIDKRLSDPDGTWEWMERRCKPQLWVRIEPYIGGFSYEAKPKPCNSPIPFKAKANRR